MITDFQKEKLVYLFIHVSIKPFSRTGLKGSTILNCTFEKRAERKLKFVKGVLVRLLILYPCN